MYIHTYTYVYMYLASGSTVLYGPSLLRAQSVLRDLARVTSKRAVFLSHSGSFHVQAPKEPGGSSKAGRQDLRSAGGSAVNALQADAVGDRRAMQVPQSISKAGGIDRHVRLGVAFID